MKSWCFALLALAACEVGELDAPTIAIEDHQAGKDPCKDPEIQRRINIHASRSNPHVFIGTDGDDVIFGTEGDDQIFGNGGDDVICGLGGDDYIDGGDGKDAIDAGDGNDIVHGRGGSDWIWGGNGDDILFGDILDDHLFGEAGDDILIGGHGTDYMDGGAGNDFLRGDTGTDTFIGGDGYDIASFATALPPGQVEVKDDGTPSPITGIEIKLDGGCASQGCAEGDGGNEPLHGIEGIVGSSFVDAIDAPGVDVVAGTGVPAMTVSLASAYDRSGRIVDLGVVVLGGAGNDNLQIYGSPGNVKVVGAGLTAGEGCEAIDATSIHCGIDDYLAAHPHRQPSPFHYILAYGDAGDDTIQFFGQFPRELEVSASGGTGSDHLIGGAEQDIFFTGPDGTDWLEGGDGDDALISESHHIGAAWKDGARPDVSQYHDGADRLDGGPGNDQLVVDYVCGGHRYIGGPGHDIAGFARSGNPGIWAQLGGVTSKAHQTRWYGFAANMDKCGNQPSAWTSWKTGADADLEVLEASDGPDHLWGSDQADTIWGRGGGDHIWGFDGNDTILAADGRDVVDGGAGHNTISWGDQSP
ncbi:MAG TPA: calcium-binding protein [Kofleriaceae bacterium]|jgi:Ca2+-binding RTX toxin-like protein